MKKLLVLFYTTSLLCAFVSCASTPDAIDSESETEDLISDESGLAVEHEHSTANTDDTQNTDSNSSAPQEMNDSIAELENQRIDELFGDENLPIEQLSSSEYRTYVNSRFQYRAAIPVSWYIHEGVVNRSGVTELKRNSAEIRIESAVPSRGDRKYYRSKAISAIEKKDATYRTIIAEREIQMFAGVYGDLMVHEYTKKRIPYLRRTIILTTDENAYIIVCEAPTSQFYTTEAAFNTFVRSFQPGNY